MPQPTLQQLSEAKALVDITKPGYKFSDFTSLDPRLQELLFRRWQEETARVKAHYPETDLKIVQEAPIVIHELPERSASELHSRSQDDKKWEEYAEPWEKVSYYRHQKLWTPIKQIKDARYINNIRDYDEYEDNNNVFRWHSTGLGFAAPGEPLIFRSAVPKEQWEQSGFDLHPLNERISSQVLLYRLMKVFGAPSFCFMTWDGQPLNWSIQLKLRDGTAGFLLYDLDGQSSAEFAGTTQVGSDLAFELLNFLCSHNGMPPVKMHIGHWTCGLRKWREQDG